VDLAGTYVVHLQVTNDLGDSSKGPTSPDVFQSTNSSFVSVVHETKDRGWRIPGSFERNWADYLYSVFVDMDENLIGVWDEEHLLEFTTGLTARIFDDRPAGSRITGGLTVSTQTGVGPDVPGIYTSFLAVPLPNQNVSGASVGFQAQLADIGLRALFVEDYCIQHAIQAAPYDSDFARIEAVGPEATIINYSSTDSGTTSVLHAVDRPTEIVNPWGTTGVINTETEEAIYHFDTLSMKKMVLDVRSSEAKNSQNGDDGIIQIHNQNFGLTNPEDRDFHLIRVIRHETTGFTGQDEGIQYTDDYDVTTGGTGDADSRPTWWLRRGSGDRYSVPGVVGALDPLTDARTPYQAPVLFVGRKRISHPGGGSLRILSEDLQVSADEFLNGTTINPAVESMSVVGRVVSVSGGVPLWYQNFDLADLSLGLGTPLESGGALQIPVSVSFRDTVIQHRYRFSIAAANNQTPQTSSRTTLTDLGYEPYIRSIPDNTFWIDAIERGAGAADDRVVASARAFLSGGTTLTGFDLVHQSVRGSARNTTYEGDYVISVEPQFFSGDTVDIEFMIIGRVN
jgi:hypothetical protein